MVDLSSPQLATNFLNHEITIAMKSVATISSPGWSFNSEENIESLWETQRKAVNTTGLSQLDKLLHKSPETVEQQAVPSPIT